MQMSLNYSVIPDNVISERVVALKAAEVNWSHITYGLANLIINTIHSLLDKNCRSPGVTWCPLLII